MEGTQHSWRLRGGQTGDGTWRRKWFGSCRAVTGKKGLERPVEEFLFSPLSDQGPPLQGDLEIEEKHTKLEIQF